MGKKPLSLSEKLTQLTAESFANFEIPEDDFDTLPAKLVDQDDLEEEEEGRVDKGLTEVPTKSILRAKNTQLLENMGVRYSGSKVTRKNLGAFGESSDDEEMDMTQDDQSEGGDEEAEEEEEEDFEGQEMDKDEGESDESGEEDQDSRTMTMMSKVDEESEREKAKAVQSQLRIWDGLLEIRMRMQKLLNNSNKLPVLNDQDTIVEDAHEAQVACKSLLNQLLDLQEVLLKDNPEANESSNRGTKRVKNDEEITSSSEESEEEISSEKMQKSPKKKKRKSLEDFLDCIEGRSKSFETYRDSTIQKWNEKTQMAAVGDGKKNFPSAQVPTLKQIGHILMDRDRLLRRTQIRRSDYSVLALEPLQKEEDDGVDPEIFDDDDFYHGLLREMIERRSAGAGDPVEISRTWQELQKVRSKLKRKVDTRASKGRKIRYDVHPKLVNFMAPRDDGLMSETAVRELFSSLFGRRQVNQPDDGEEQLQDVSEVVQNIFT